MQLTRRQFLLSSGAALSAAAVPLVCLGCPGGPSSPIPFPYEGIYTDNFTYRPGDTICVFASLISGAPVQISIWRYDTPPAPVVIYTVSPSDAGNSNFPSSSGACFDPVLYLAASDFAPGIYQISIYPMSAMQSQNQIDDFNGFPSRNYLSYFVVTPSVAGSTSPILWVHDSLTGTAYGSFGGLSIYPTPSGAETRTASWLRPGLDRCAENFWPLPFLQQNGHVFEHVDLVDLAGASPGYLDAYNLVCVVGQFEYIPHEVMEQFESYLAGGGNVFAASHEFGTWRVRLDQNARTMTTYKWDYLGYDPYYLSGDPAQLPYVAGTGMSSPASPYETEITGQTVWSANNIAPGGPLDMPIYNLGTAGWIFDGTGLGAGDVLPGALNGGFASGCCLQFDASNQPFPILTSEMRIPDGTVVWAALPSSDALDWRLAAGQSVYTWPTLASGYATATLQQRSSGAQVVSYPAAGTALYTTGSPVYAQMLLNIFSRLSSRS